MNDIAHTLPPKDREEWRRLVRNELSHYFQNYVLQMKVAYYGRKIKEGSIDIQTAVDEVYALCIKYIKAVQRDFRVIFKDW